MLKKPIFLLFLLLLCMPLFATVHVRSTVTRKGVYRRSHVRTSPDHSRLNNWSARGNVNPVTGKKGYKRTVK